MANFGPMESVPEQFKDRTLYQHNPQVTLLRTNTEENAKLGSILAEKINAYQGPVSVQIPSKGISVISESGGPFHDKAADHALFDALKDNLDQGTSIESHDLTINSQAFAEHCAKTLLELMQDR